MSCPGCGAVPPATAVPKETLGHLESRHKGEGWWNPDAWWCPTCLAAKIAADHAVDCRCGGCATAAAS